MTSKECLNYNAPILNMPISSLTQIGTLPIQLRYILLTMPHLISQCLEADFTPQKVKKKKDRKFSALLMHGFNLYILYRVIYFQLKELIEKQHIFKTHLVFNKKKMLSDIMISP